jgi:hypothetical protein
MRTLAAVLQYIGAAALIGAVGLVIWSLSVEGPRMPWKLIAGVLVAAAWGLIRLGRYIREREHRA